MKLRVLALAGALLLGATACSLSPTEPAETPTVPIPDAPDGNDYPTPPKP